MLNFIELDYESCSVFGVQMFVRWGILMSFDDFRETYFDNVNVNKDTCARLVNDT